MNNVLHDQHIAAPQPCTSDKQRRSRERGNLTLEQLLWGFVVAVVILSIFVFFTGTVRKKVFCAVENVFAQQGQQGSDCQ
jgi:hypothetical protein